jgi:hypothetical protein
VHPVVEGDAAVDRNPELLRNIMVVATNGAAPDKQFLLGRWRERGPKTAGAPDLVNAIGDRWDKPIPVDDVPVLTDDYAPTDALLLFDG